MDSFLQKFSLQNLLRQFFCGVVFFVPLWLFTQDPGRKCCTYSVLDITQWETGTFLLFVALASVIGTIVYHVEKNLYSYLVQTLFESFAKYKNWQMRVVPLLVAGAITVMISPLFQVPEDKGDVFNCYMVALSFFVVICIFNVLFTESFFKVMIRTRASWIIEEQFCDKSSEDRLARWAVAKRISSWSDFIHCSQSCCFAWLLGCLLCKFANNIEVQNTEFFGLSIVVVASILFLEIIFDWHRYQHVLAMTESDLLGDIQKEYPQMKINSNVVSKHYEIIVKTVVKSKEL